MHAGKQSGDGEDAAAEANEAGSDAAVAEQQTKAPEEAKKSEVDIEEDKNAAGGEDGEGAPTEAHEAGADDAVASAPAAEQQTKAADDDQPDHQGSEVRQDQSEEDELSLGDSDEEEETEAAANSSKVEDKRQPEEKQEDAPEPAAPVRSSTRPLCACVHSALGTL